MKQGGKIKTKAVKHKERVKRLSLIYTHEGLKQAGGHEEPQHAARRRPRRNEPQQQIGEDGERSGQNQPAGQTSAERGDRTDGIWAFTRGRGIVARRHRPTNQGLSFPTPVQRLRPTRYPIRGSVTASQARLTNKTRDT